MVGQGVAAPFVVLAERQTAGRGRRGRNWVSPFAENIYYSLVLPVTGGMRQLEGLSLVVGLAVLNALREVGVPGGCLRGLDGVLFGNKKIAGILLELVGDPADVCHVVLGIGINVNMRSSSAVDQAWTSAYLEAGRPMDRNALVMALNESLMRYLKIHEVSGFSALKTEWELNHLWQEREVTLIAGLHEVVGKVLGVDQQGALRMNINGVEKIFNGGELSLRLRHDS